MLLLLPLVKAAEFVNTYRPSTEVFDVWPNADHFSQFVSDLNSGDFSVTSQFHQFVPFWMQSLQTVKVEEDQNLSHVVIEEGFKEHLDFLANPEIPLSEHHQSLLKPITMHLQLIAKKIVATLNYAHRHFIDQQAVKVCTSGLQGLAMRLFKNAHSFPALMDEFIGKDLASPEEAYTMAVMAGLLAEAREGDRGIDLEDMKTLYPKNLLAIMGINEERSGMDDSDQLSVAWQVGKLLFVSEEVMSVQDPAIHQLIENLTMIRQASFSYCRHLKWKLHKLIAMIPVGYRFALGIDCKDSNNATLLDMIKADDGCVYGVLYPRERLPIAICTPIPRLIQLITALRKSNNLETIKDLSSTLSQEVNLRWYPFKSAKTNLRIVTLYAKAWPIGDRLNLGLVWHICKQLVKDNPKEPLVAHFKNWLKVADGLSPKSASLLYAKVKDMKSKSYQNDLDSLKRRIFAQMN